MHKKAITYTNWDDEQETRTFYFNLSAGEIAQLEIEFSNKGGLTRTLQAIGETSDPSEVLELVKHLVGKAYGVKGQDGVSFIKSEDYSNGFLGSEAFSSLFLEMLQNPDEMNAFFVGILPKEARDKIASAGGPQDFLKKEEAAKTTVIPESGSGIVAPTSVSPQADQMPLRRDLRQQG